MEKEALWQAGRREPQEAAAAPEQPVDEEPAVIEPPPQVAPPLSVQAPQSAKKVRLFEPDVSEAGRLPKAAAEPGQDGRALWEAFEKEQATAADPPPEKAVVKPRQPEAEAPLPIPRAPEAVRLRDEKTSGPVATPAVTLGGRREVEGAGAPVSPPPLPTGKAKEETLPRAQDAADDVADAKPFIAPKPAPTEPEDPETAKKTRWRKLGEKVGLSSLALSVGIHLLLLTTGALVVVHQVMDTQVDFLPGGGSAQGEQAAQALQHKIQQKKNPWLKKTAPIRKLAVENSIANVVLPTDAPDMLDIPDTSKTLGGGMVSGSFGLGGAGGGFGKGLGLGGRNGMVFGPLFGLNIKAKKLAVVLDVSTSMAPHLERVVKEVDKVAKGSVVVLYFGCGLEPPPKPLVGTKIFRTSSIEFEKFWRLGGATYMDTAKFKIDSKIPISSESVFRTLSKRPQTYFIHHVGLGYTWLALLSEEVRNSDGLYWFSDFQDIVEFKQTSVVLDNLLRRKQHLYIHSYGKGQYFELVKNQLVVPTNGDSYIEE